MSINTSKYTNHTKEEILKYLNNIRKSIKKDKFTVSRTENNQKNNFFIDKYNLNSVKIKLMLLQLEVNDFCYSVDDYKHPTEKLYIFSRSYMLNNWGEDEEVEVYFKFSFKQNNFLVVVSFHEREKNIQKLFV